jgi:hypothetical protein
LIKELQPAAFVSKSIRATVIIYFLVAFSALQAQDRCATHLLQKLQGRTQAVDQQFEQWLKSRTPVSAKGVTRTARTKATYKIPVVVHIIHNGLTHATNISDEQVFSQIRVLNDDYNRENADAGQTPAEFLAVAGAMDIEFVLAKRTPEGLPTNGIVRVQGNQTSWRYADNYALKSLSYWPAENYLNIWVCNLVDYLGYAQFPQTDLLNGLENQSTNRLTDGVVIAYDAFGSADDGDFDLDPKYNKGRTATHEIGHFFGLRHISGDDDGACPGGNGFEDDYVSDTPAQASQNYNCPSHPQSSCAIVSMFQNYLDYTNDGCMNIFTKGQMDRMDIIIKNSPRRKTLLTSLGATEPEPVANDLGIKEIVTPQTGECSGDLIPTVELRNYGNNPITSAQVRLLRDGIPLETKDLLLNLGDLESTVAEFSSVSITPGSYSYTFQILQTNGGADGNNTNNTTTTTVFSPETIETPFKETFDELPANWRAENPDDGKTWELSNVTIGTTPNSALKMDFYDYEDDEGEVDFIVTPVIDFTDATVGLLLFDIAHARYQGSNDRMKVVLLTNCNSNLNEGVTIFDKSGAALATHSDINSAYTPSSSTDWRTESVNLNDYIGQKIQLAFIGINDWGNNLYLDNIRVVTNSFSNLTLVKAVAPSPVNCQEEIIPTLVVRNSGTNISYFEVSYTINGLTKVHPVDEGIWESGAEREVTLPAIELETGENEISFTLQQPDFNEDVDPSDNSLHYTAGLIKQQNLIPFREDFENDFENKWMIINPNSGDNWKLKSLDQNQSLVHDGFTNMAIGDESWLVSSVVDLSTVENPSLYFDISYAVREGVSDLLDIRASVGCASNFDKLLATYSGSTLSETISNTAWVPQSSDDWVNKSVDLTSLTGESEVRFAFVVRNNRGNNLYLDNIELFLSDKVVVDDFFNVYPNPTYQPEGKTFIAFKLPELSDIEIEITDNVGRLISRTHHSNILNQTLELPVSDFANGLYFVRVITSENVYLSKLILGR